ncbi:MAG: hypothetical protein ACYDCO_13685, partial [Armatimonadota bacterium]
MKPFAITLAVVNFLLLFSVTTCALWIRAQKVVDPSSVDFHMKIGLAAVVVSAIVTVLVIVLAS